ncbi:MAG TPA: TorF family putative porin [Phenylobacterium sp.]
MKALKIALLGAAASLALSGAAFAQDDSSGVEVSFNAGAATDYVFRGISQTDENPQFFGGADLTTGIFYAGVWASNVDFGDDTDAEVDLYAGVKPTVGAVSLDLGAIYYGYVNEPGGADWAYWEFKAAASIPAGPATIGGAIFYSPDYTGAGTDEGIYYEINGAVPLMDKLTLSGAFGHQDVEICCGLGDANYNTWNVGVGYAIDEHVGFDLRYWDTDEDFLGDLGEERVVLGMKITL